MMRLNSVSTTNEEVLQRVREIVAEQMAMDVFEVKACDSLDADLGIAGEDIDQILAAVHSEFETNFSELADYWQYFFYPEISALGFRAQVAIFLLVSMIFLGVTTRIYRSATAWSFASLLLILLVLWRKLARKHRLANYEGDKLRFTIEDIVNAVCKGQWVAPEDIWDQIGRLG